MISGGFPVGQSALFSAKTADSGGTLPSRGGGLFGGLGGNPPGRGDIAGGRGGGRGGVISAVFGPSSASNIHRSLSADGQQASVSTATPVNVYSQPVYNTAEESDEDMGVGLSELPKYLWALQSRTHRQAPLKNKKKMIGGAGMPRKHKPISWNSSFLTRPLTDPGPVPQSARRA